ncbi:hypothetical protein SpCBS45565_g01117 [Spizellomyces sp. 'palustris']|nr:hypothetical protein SpCBS45565_g01117 [Spizellomyces sp. 'palustris']
MPKASPHSIINKSQVASPRSTASEAEDNKPSRQRSPIRTRSFSGHLPGPPRRLSKVEYVPVAAEPGDGGEVEGVCEDEVKMMTIKKGRPKVDVHQKFQEERKGDVRRPRTRRRPTRPATSPAPNKDHMLNLITAACKKSLGWVSSDDEESPVMSIPPTVDLGVQMWKEEMKGIVQRRGGFKSTAASYPPSPITRYLYQQGYIHSMDEEEKAEPVASSHPRTILLDQHFVSASLMHPEETSSCCSEHVSWSAPDPINPPVQTYRPWTPSTPLHGGIGRKEITTYAHRTSVPQHQSSLLSTRFPRERHHTFPFVHTPEGSVWNLGPAKELFRKLRMLSDASPPTIVVSDAGSAVKKGRRSVRGTGEGL